MFLALALTCAATSALGQDFSADELARRTIERRAVEAVIWGMPAVNTELMYQAMLKLGGKPNQIVYWSRLLDWRNQTLTPNPDVIYLMAFFDLRDGPIVIQIPPADGGVINGSRGRIWWTGGLRQSLTHRSLEAPVVITPDNAEEFVEIVQRKLGNSDYWLRRFWPRFR